MKTKEELEQYAKTRIQELKDIVIEHGGVLTGKDEENIYTAIFGFTLNNIDCQIRAHKNTWGWDRVVYKLNKTSITLNFSSTDILKSKLRLINRIEIPKGLSLFTLLEPLGITQNSTRCDGILKAIWYKEDKIVSYLHTPQRVFLIVKSMRNLIRGYVVSYREGGYWNENCFSPEPVKKILAEIDQFKDYKPEYQEINDDDRTMVDLVMIKGGK